MNETDDEARPAARAVPDRVFAALPADRDARGALDWLLHYLDGTVVRAHQHAAGAPQKGPRSRTPKRGKPSAGRAVA